MPGANSPQNGHRLNTKDVEDALEFILSLGNRRSAGETFKVFDYIIDVGNTVLGALNSNKEAQKVMSSDIAKLVINKLVKALDANGDGRITARDFQIMYDRDLRGVLQRHKSVLDEILPLAGQSVFGFTMGFIVGRLARHLYRQRFAILVSSFLLYNGFQYVAQLSFINRNLLESEFKKKVQELADLNGDGELSMEDVNFLIENRMRYIATKLGPGGIAPGMLGYATLIFGAMRGFRGIRRM